MVERVKLHYVYDYTDVDRAFWAEHLEDWVPRRLVDAHQHLVDPALRREPMTEAMRRSFWVNEVNEPMSAETVERCMRIVYPGREVTPIAFAYPDLAYDIEASNAYVSQECARRGWYALALVRPQWDRRQVEALLGLPGVIGVKPYYSLISHDPHTRDRHLESSIFDFLPHELLEVLNERHAWVTLHVPRAARLGHPENLREIRELRRRYPRVVTVIAHLGRCYTEPHAREALPHLADDAGLYFDISAVLNPAVLRLALKCIGPERLLYGTDNPVFFMRGRRTWEGRQYINHTSHDFFFNRGRHEPPEVEARYTLYMYEALRALKEACGDLGISGAGVEGIFRDNAERLIAGVLAGKRSAAR